MAFFAVGGFITNSLAQDSILNKHDSEVVTHVVKDVGSVIQHVGESTGQDFIGRALNSEAMHATVIGIVLYFVRRRKLKRIKQGLDKL